MSEDQRIELAVRAVELATDQSSEVSMVAVGLIAVIATLFELGSAQARAHLGWLLGAVTCLGISCGLGFLVVGRAAGSLAVVVQQPPATTAEMVAELSPYTHLASYSMGQMAMFAIGLALFVVSAVRIAARRGEPH